MESRLDALYDGIVLTSVDITGLRGIREGQLSNLPRLGVFVGPNGTGKSTVLEALLIAAHPDPAEAVGRVVRGRRAQSGARWLFHRGEPNPVRIAVEATNGSRQCILQLNPSEQGHTIVHCEVPLGKATWRADVRFASDNAYDRVYDTNNPKMPSLGQVRWLAPFSHFQAQLHDVYSDVVRQGRRHAAKKILAMVIPNFEDIEILMELDQPTVHVVFEDHSVPVGVMGDGVQSLVRLSLELAARPGGLALIEEPEVHEHPGAIRQSVKAILEATRRGVQVLLSTHSLDLIDALLAECDPDETAMLSVFRFALQDGILKTTRIPGPDVAFARGQIGNDLR